MLKRDGGGTTRRPVLWLAAVAAVPVLWAGCSASRKSGVRTAPAAEPTAAAPATPAAAAQNADAVLIQSAGFTEDQDGARLVLTADRPLFYTSYQLRPDLLVIELAGTRTARGFSSPAVSGSLVTGLQVDASGEMGKANTRISVSHRPGIRYEVSSEGKTLAIAFNAAVAERAEPTAEKQPAAPPPISGSAPAVPSAPAKSAAAAATEPAHVLEAVEVQGGGDALTVVLLGDGSLKARDFTLANPPRIVLDLVGVKNEVRAKTLAVRRGVVERVRVAQFSSSPQAVRVVIDLTRPTPYQVHPDGETLRVAVGEEVADVIVSPPPAGPVPSRTVIAEAPAPAAAKPESTPAAPAEQSHPKPAAPSAPSAAPPQAPVAIKEPTTDTRPLVDVPKKSGRESIPRGERLPGVRAASRKPRPKVAEPSKGADQALFEAAAAMLEQEEAKGPKKTELPNIYQSKTVGGETQYSGEPISLDLKDADIKDVFRTVSQLTGLNIVIDPDVRGTVTVRLEDVPWDQALELMLKQNGLGYVLENNVMRIAAVGKLEREENERRALEEARQTAIPTKTVIKKLSYADAGQAAGTLQKVMSKRGDIIVDVRTNTVIIREIPAFMPTVIQLLENLDTPTPQVMIETRIVETTKTFGRSLGISWGFTGVSDVAHGNTTNLIFPNNADVTGRVNLATGTNLLTLRLGNVLDTFNLDIALQAAENEGLAKVVSSPRAVAMTNKRAFIQSGVQIPVQTTVNNTTTVTYVDATLRLEVTPQITAEGTVLLDVRVQKREPAVALNIALGQNIPLTIREAQTQVLVKDGGTAVIGGIFTLNDQDQNNRIPGLWRIPVLGNLFKSKVISNKHDELLIFITPRIIHQ